MMVSNNSVNYFDQINEAVEYLTEKGFKSDPCAALIFGSGLDTIAEGMKIEMEIPYGEIPGFAETTLGFHKGRLLYGRVAGKPVVAMDGRLHYYEGYTMKQITFPLRVMRGLGAENLLLSNISGCLNPEYRSGDIVIITDHINMMGDNPLIGANDDRLGTRFPDMMEPYSRKLIELAEKHAMRMDLRLARGVYIALSGSCFETPAEYRMLRTLGADMVGMSSVPEVIAAVHGGMRILGLSLISDECFPDCLAPVKIEDLLERAQTGSDIINRIFSAVISDEGF